jgi:hypothetical protein
MTVCVLFIRTPVHQVIACQQFICRAVAINKTFCKKKRITPDVDATMTVLLFKGIFGLGNSGHSGDVDVAAWHPHFRRVDCIQRIRLTIYRLHSLHYAMFFVNILLKLLMDL